MINNILSRDNFSSICPSQYFWDPLIIKDGNLWRLYALSTEESEGLVWWRRAYIHEVISEYSKKWKDVGPLYEPGIPGSWDEARIMGFSMFKEEGIYYLFHSASDKQCLRYEKIALAQSKDGRKWQRPEKQLFEPDPRWYQVKVSFSDHLDPQVWPKDYGLYAWRDPWIFKNNTPFGDDKYYIFFAANMNEGDSNYRAVVGLAVADKIAGPYEVLPPALAPLIEPGKSMSASAFGEMERPMVFYRFGKFWLLFSCWEHKWHPEFKEKMKKMGEVNSSTIWIYVSDNIAGPYEPFGNKPFVEGSHKTGLYVPRLMPDPDFPTDPDRWVAYGHHIKSFRLDVTFSHKVIWKEHSIIMKTKTQTFCSRVLNKIKSYTKFVSKN